MSCPLLSTPSLIIYPIQRAPITAWLHMIYFFIRNTTWPTLTFRLYPSQFQPADKKDLIETFSEPVKLICPSEVRLTVTVSLDLHKKTTALSVCSHLSALLSQEHPYIYTRPKSLNSANHLPVMWTLLTLSGLITSYNNMH